MATATRTAPKSKVEKPAETSAETSAEKPAAKPITDLIKEFDWNAVVDEAQVAEYTRGPSARDVEAETPQRIKEDLATSFAGYDAQANAGKGQPLWMTRSLPSPQMAQAYMKIARDYGKFKGWTVRGDVDPNAPTRVRFCAKPKEMRTRKDAKPATPPAAVASDASSAVSVDGKTAAPSA